MCASLTKNKPPNHKGKVNSIAIKITEWVEHRGKLKLGEIALALGYNYAYLKYKILPAILETEECIRMVKIDNITYLEWVCREVKESADETKVLEAKPVDEEPKASKVEWGGSE